MYQANPDCPIFHELNSLVIKTVGVADIIRAALAPLADKMDQAMIFGSFARGEQHEQSDVDLFIVSDAVTLMQIVKALKPAQEQLRREINPVLYSRSEYDRKLRARHHFLTRILREPTIRLIGGDVESR
jgi:predicted nucleotidyltransferase